MIRQNQNTHKHHQEKHYEKTHRLTIAHHAQRLLRGLPVMAFVAWAVVAVLVLSVSPVHAAEATLYLDPASKTVEKGESFTAYVRLDTGGEPVNAVEASLTYPDSKLRLDSIDSSNSAFEIEAGQNGANGDITISRATTSPKTGDVEVSRLNFTARVDSGDGTVSFTNESNVVHSDTNQDILGSTQNGTYSFTAAPSSDDGGGADDTSAGDGGSTDDTSSGGGGGSSTTNPSTGSDDTSTDDTRQPQDDEPDQEEAEEVRDGDPGQPESATDEEDDPLAGSVSDEDDGNVLAAGLFGLLAIAALVSAGLLLYPRTRTALTRPFKKNGSTGADQPSNATPFREQTPNASTVNSPNIVHPESQSGPGDQDKQ